MLLKNGEVFCENGFFEKKNVCTQGMYISETSSDDIVIDVTDKYVVPGFIDIHFHGAMGCDFMDARPESLKTIARYEATHGITTIVPATLTMPKEDIFRALQNAFDFIPEKDEANLGGVYLEGPFISNKKIGAQNGKYVIASDPEFLKSLLDEFPHLLKVVAIAPEIEGGLNLISDYSDRVRFSLAHTDADYETSLKAFDCGARQLTHTFNAMNPLHHRHSGPIGAAFSNGNISTEIICDGVHIHESVVAMMFKLFSQMVMISDSMEATGLGNGNYSLGGKNVIVKGNLATLEDGTIAGSVTNLYCCFNKAVRSMHIPLEETIIACTKNPAQCCGIYSNVGSISIGKRADLLVIDRKTLKLNEVILRGKRLTFSSC
jgi:N-acetylglucosamine-6-phosphate deacetylase